MTTLDDVAAEFCLDDAQVAGLGRYLDLLLGWRRGNVTGVRTRAAAVDRLLADSLALLDVPALTGAGGRWLDLGAGAGVPGIPLAVARPAARLVLLDAEAKKCAFLEAAVVEAGLGGRATVVHARSEAYAAAAPTGGSRPADTACGDDGPGGRECSDVVFARAVSGLATVVELAAPLVATGGVLLAVKTAAGAEGEAPRAAAAAALCGLRPAGTVALTRSPIPGSVCVVYAKAAPAPGWLPRRPGLAQKHPLGT